MNQQKIHSNGNELEFFALYKIYDDEFTKVVNLHHLSNCIDYVLNTGDIMYVRHILKVSDYSKNMLLLYKKYITDLINGVVEDDGIILEYFRICPVTYKIIS